MAKNRLMIFLLVLLAATTSVFGIAPGGVYRNRETVSLTLDERTIPHTLGYHMVRGTVRFHGRAYPFSSGVFLPPAFFHASQPLPILMALHNKYAVGSNSDAGLAGEGMGQMLAHGNPDGRAVGDTAANPISLRQDAQFIGLAPLCPSGTGWDSPPVPKLLCQLIAKMVTTYHADDDRVYLTGFSFGASNTWQVALAVPDRFAAIICCDGRATANPPRDVAKLSNVAIYLEVGQWDGPFVEETDRMHQALNTLPHRNYVFRMIPGGNHFCYQTVYNDPQVWKWVYAQHRQPGTSTTSVR